MNQSRRLFLLFSMGVAAMAVVSVEAAQTHRFENEIAAFEKADRTNFPPANAILFLGSSSIRKWATVARDFPAHKVINRGFGGSELSDSVYYFDRIVLPYKPKMIVLYAGSNDLNAGKTPETVVNDFEAFAAKVAAALPDTKIAFISVNASPSRWKDVEKVRQTNRDIAAFIAKNPNLIFIDTFPAMLDEKAEPRPELYIKDRLHMNAKGYAIWTAIIAPYLDRAD